MNIVLGVCGGIAAYKSVALARLLVEAGHRVQVIPTEHALNFVGAATWEAISGNPVGTSVFAETHAVRHVRLGQEADAVIVAPATADTLARMAAGLAGDLLGTTLLATRAPVIVAPAMHTEMWEHPATRHNLGVLRDRGVIVVGPENGRLTGADSGPGRMSEPERIVAELRARVGAEAAARPQTLAGARVVVSAGGTREPIDPVRFIGNRSSGRQGVAVALAAAERGAEVELLAANVEEAVLAELGGHPRIAVVPVSTTEELGRALDAAAASAQVVVMAAAVADFRPAAPAQQKIRKAELGDRAPVIPLVQNPDLLAGLVERSDSDRFIVGFAAETAEDEARLLELGREKARRKGADLLVVNPVGWSTGFETDRNSVRVLDRGGEVVLRSEGTKHEVAAALVDLVASLRDRAAAG